MKTNLILVESPLQLLNAYEAIHFFDLKEYQILLRFSGIEKNDFQMSQLIKTLGFNLDCVECISINESKKTPLDLIKLALYRVKYVFSAKKVERIFIGNFSSGFFSLIRSQFSRNQMVLLDDGSRTIEIQKAFSDNSNFDLFTMYDIEPYKNQKIYLNTFANLKIRSKQNLQVDDGTILFLGSGLSEINIITSSEYIKLITEISIYYQTQNKNILYIPHRSEDAEKVSVIAQLANVEVLYVTYPIELYGIFEQKIPATIASFYSTALLTMKNIYNLHSQAFLFNYKGSEHEAAIDDIYLYYADKVKIINLNNLSV